MSYQPATQYLKSAFGELETVSPTPVFQYSFEYTVDNTELTTNATTGSGTITQGDAMAAISSSATASSTAYLKSHRVGRYHPGQGSVFRFTAMFTSGVGGTEQWAGLSDGASDPSANNAALLVGYSGTAFSIRRVKDSGDNVDIALSACDDPLDGTGASGMTLDPTKLNVFEIRFQYLGAGKIDFMVESDTTGEFVIFHTINYANANIIPSLYNPNMRGVFYVNNSAVASNLTIKTASMGYFIEGNTTIRDVHRPFFGTGKQQKTTVTTEVAICTIRAKSTYASKPNFIESMLLGVSAAIEASTSNNLAYVRVVKNATLGGSPSYSDINTNNSTVEIDTAGTTVTGGTELFGEGLAGKNDKFAFNFKDWQVIIEPGDTITVAAESTNSATAIDAAITWQELF